jgi:hypothetical protein
MNARLPAAKKTSKVLRGRNFFTVVSKITRIPTVVTVPKMIEATQTTILRMLMIETCSSTLAYVDLGAFYPSPN